MAGELDIAVVFATMHRPSVAERCVLALAHQTRPPTRVVVAANDATDGTAEALEKLPNLPFELVVHRMAENLGNAGGVRDAMELAFAAGADAVWILDDDSWPRPDALKELLQGAWDPTLVRHPLQIDPRTKRFTWPLFIGDGSGGWRLAFDESELSGGAAIPSRITWTGALISREIREVVGPVNGDLFIRGEDEEYPWRIEQAGFTQLAYRAAVMDHPGPENVVHWKLMGKNFFFERGLADWKLYYKVRNMVWLKRRQNGTARTVKIAASYVVAAVMLDGPRRMPLLWRAIRDGWRGRLGKM